MNKIFSFTNIINMLYAKGDIKNFKMCHHQQKILCAVLLTLKIIALKDFKFGEIIYKGSRLNSG